MSWCHSEDAAIRSSLSSLLAQAVTDSERDLTIRNNLLWPSGYQVTYLFQQTNSETGVSYSYRQQRLINTFNFYTGIVNISFVQVYDESDNPDVHVWFNDDTKDGVSWCITGLSNRGYLNPSERDESKGANGGLPNTSCFFSTSVQPTPLGSDARLAETHKYFHTVGHLLGLEHRSLLHLGASVMNYLVEKGLLDVVPTQLDVALLTVCIELSQISTICLTYLVQGMYPSADSAEQFRSALRLLGVDATKDAKTLYAEAASLSSTVLTRGQPLAQLRTSIMLEVIGLPLRKRD